MFDNGEDRSAAVNAWAKGDLHCMAAAWLLMEHGHWLPMLDRAGLLETWETNGVQYARPRLLDALDLMESGRGDLYASGSEYRILALAASLAQSYPVNVSWVLDSLDKTNGRLVMEAVGRATRVIPVIGG